MFNHSIVEGLKTLVPRSTFSGKIVMGGNKATILENKNMKMKNIVLNQIQIHLHQVLVQVLIYQLQNLFNQIRFN